GEAGRVTGEQAEAALGVDGRRGHREIDAQDVGGGEAGDVDGGDAEVEGDQADDVAAAGAGHGQFVEELEELGQLGVLEQVGVGVVAGEVVDAAAGAVAAGGAGADLEEVEGVAEVDEEGIVARADEDLAAALGGEVGDGLLRDRLVDLLGGLAAGGGEGGLAD